MCSLGRFLTGKLNCYNLFATKSHHFLRHQIYRFIHSSCFHFFVGEDPNDVATALAFSENSRSLFLGTQIHGRIIKLGLTSDVFSQNNLIKMYARNGGLRDGFKVFDEMHCRNVVSWTLLISGAFQCGEIGYGLHMYVDMIRTGLFPNEFTIGSVMKACADMRDSGFGLCVHCFVLKVGIERNWHVGSSILSFYAKWGNIEAAESMFNCMDDVDVGCWNTMLGGYAQCGYGYEVINIASLMKCKGIIMDKYTFISSLQGCSMVGDLNFGRQIHGLIIKSWVEFSSSINNALMDMYFKNFRSDCAWKVFKCMHDRDLVTWNTMLGSFSQLEDLRKVANLFHDFMLTDLRPNHITFSILFRQCGELPDIDLGFQFYCLALHLGFSSDAKVTSSLINMFSMCGAIIMARSLFDSLVFKEAMMWNELISGYNLNNCVIEALQTFRSLLRLGDEPNENTYSVVLEACCRSDDQQMWRQIHGVVVKSGYASHEYVSSSLAQVYIEFGQLDDLNKFINGLERRNIVSWSAIMSKLVHQGYYSEAIIFFNSLIKAGRKPDEFILGSVLNGCAGIAAYLQTKSVHLFVTKLGFGRHVFVATALLDSYAKCGDIRSAKLAFDQSFQSKDVVICNAMIMAYAHHGLISEALHMFDKMKLANLEPSQATFVSVISACGHKGLVQQGCLLFESMVAEFGLEPSPDNYGCLVDMLSRNGYLEDAKYIIEMMPYPPWPAILRSLLSGCRIYGNSTLGQWAARMLLQLSPDHDATHSLLFKVYSEMGSWEDAMKFTGGTRERHLKMDPGSSRIELSSSYSFKTGNYEHSSSV